jgi:hypothetical protein
VTAPSLLDFALACIFIVGGVCGWVLRWFYAERSR